VYYLGVWLAGRALQFFQRRTRKNPTLVNQILTKLHVLAGAVETCARVMSSSNW
jgi:hypothetical protein